MSVINIFKRIVYLLTRKKAISARVLASVTRDWQEIETLTKGGSPSQLKQALITADRSLDSVLKDLTAGETMGERLKNAKSLFHPQSYDKIWQAHKLRNVLVHEAGFEVQSFVLEPAIKDLKTGLRELGVKI